MLENKVNWIITEGCNRNCSYCFAPKELTQDNSKINIRLAEKLAKSKLKAITISGGEPLLVNNLLDIIKLLQESGIYVSLHTNGDFLTLDKIKQLKPFLGDIGIPIDSMDLGTQESRRGVGSLASFKKAYGNLNREGVKTRIHTVADKQNITRLTAIYNYLCKGKFDSWRIYEENSEERLSEDVGDFSSDGDVDCFFARFLIAENRMRTMKDKRVKFIATEDKKPYIFLRANGEIKYGAYFNPDSILFGNLLNEPLAKIKERIGEQIGHGTDFEGFFRAKSNLPAWARMYEGNLDDEEWEYIETKIPLDIQRRMIFLEQLYAKHQKAR
ncbi:MAG: radical SAM protein [archaeon]|nr:radical SAM protein [archaeon]